MKRIRRLTTTQFSTNISLRRANKNPKTSITQGESSLDRILSRVSNIAQTGLFVLTALTLYYTVIPLYKTALLEEQISKKEIELKELEIRRAEQYSALKNITLESFVARNIRCFIYLSDEEEAENTTIKSRAARDFEIDIEGCILSDFKNNPEMRFLQRSDAIALKSEIDAINLDINLLREKYLKEFNKVSLDSADSYSTPKPNTYLGRTLNFLNDRCIKLANSGIPCDQSKHTKEIKLHSEKLRITSEFRDKAIERFKKIWDLRSKTIPSDTPKIS